MKTLLLAATILAAGSGLALAHTVTTAPLAVSTAQAQTHADGVQVAQFGMMHRERRWFRHRRFHRG